MRNNKFDDISLVKLLELLGLDISDINSNGLIKVNFNNGHVKRITIRKID